MFTDYKAQVILAYKKKRNLRALSLNLLQSTPAKLRAECLIVINERYLKKDENTLKVFFGPKSDMTAYMQAIRRFDADKFKPLDNFLKGITNDTEDKNIELLALLIDVEPRPYQFNQPGMANQPDSALINDQGLSNDTYITAPDQLIKVDVYDKANENKEIRQDGIETEALINPNISAKIKRAFNGKRIIVAFGVIMLLCGGAYLISHQKKYIKALPAPVTIGAQKCMYWTGDEYQPISCDKKVGDTLVLALDTVQLVHFKRITEPDTITAASIGKVWYAIKGKEVEFYTDGGYEPVYHRRLRPLTDYMIRKHIPSKWFGLFNKF